MLAYNVSKELGTGSDAGDSPSLLNYTVYARFAETRPVLLWHV